ncbi:hypothetical protein EV177_010170, partial [Coemansia sp. RSA 1804]
MEHRKKLCRTLFPEHLIVSEEEQDIDVENNGNAGDSDDDSDDGPQDIDGTAHTHKALVPVNSERAEDSAVDVDSEFLAFQSRIARNTDQVIRYVRSPFSDKTGEPLYV